jgi:hypothetical protein
MKNKSPIDNLEDIAINFEKLDNSFILMKEQFTEFKDVDKIKINFKDCHVAICPNGGLIAICKKKGFLDITKGTKINTHIIVMHQDAKRKYLIPIDWSYKDKYIVDLEFNEKEQLYGICNDGSILKIDILNLKAEPKITSEAFKNEPIYKCKLFENGFIALTIDGNFYYVQNIKNPNPELLFPMKSLLHFSNNIDFLPISSKYSKSKKIELLITNENGRGVIHIVKTEEGKFGIRPMEGKPNLIAYKNIHILKKDKLEVFSKENTDKKINIDKNDENMGKIVSMAMSPSKNKLAFYDNRGFVFFFSSDLNFENKVLIKINEDFSENEINEIKTLINYNEGYQFLFCGEESIALSGQRFIIIININQFQNTYKIVEGSEMDAIQGVLFSKCISEVDGIRYITNEGVFFISNVSNELYDICNPFSNCPSKKLLKAYHNSINKLANSELEIREIGNFLTDAINSLQIAAANIFWICNNLLNYNDYQNLSDIEKYNVDKKNSQLFLLEAAQYGKNFVKNENFNFDKFLEICKDIRIINNLRNHESKPKFITFNEYKSLDQEDLIKKVMRNINYGMAFEICRFLDYNEKDIYTGYAISCIKRLKYNYDSGEELKLFDILQTKLNKCPDLSYIKLAKKAFKYNKNSLGLKFLENEKSKLTKIPQYIELKEWDTAIELAENLYDSNIIITVLDKLFKRETIDKFLQIVSQHPQSKANVIEFLNNNDPEQIENYFKILKNPEELFFYYLEQYFQSPSFLRRKRLLALAKENEKLITNAINPNFEHKFYRNYLDNLENNLTFKIELLNQDKEKNIIKKPEETSFDLSVYDIYKMGVRADKYNLIETQNKHFSFTTEGMSLMRCMTYGEMGRLNEIDALLKRYNNNVKKLGLTHLNLGEIYFKFNGYNKAAENIKLINDSSYIQYKVEMLTIMEKEETALEVIISDKISEDMKKMMVNEILSKKPNLKRKAEELFIKYKVK